MSPELLNAVADYMSNTEDFRNTAVRKIASLQKGNDELTLDKQAIAKSVEALVTKMASAGIINDVHAAHLSTKAHSLDVVASLNKLTDLLEENASQKMAKAPQLYTVDESINITNNNTSEFENSWRNRLSALGRKA